MLRRCVVVGTWFVSLFLAAMPALGRTIKDIGSSGHGFSTNCPPSSGGGTCLAFTPRGTVTLNGTDAGGQPISVTIDISDWDSNPTNNPNVVFDVVLHGSDASLNLERLTVAGLLPDPAHVTCGSSSPGISCIDSPSADGDNVQEPTAIASSDGVNTQWDFGKTEPAAPFLGDRFVDLDVCVPPGACSTPGQGLGEAILVISGTFTGNNLSLNANGYLAIVSDGSGHTFKLGGLSTPPTATPATNNTKLTATAISGTHFQDFVDTSSLSPSEDAVGAMQSPNGFVLPTAPSCNPTNDVTNQKDTRVFRAAWYSYTAPSNGSVTISTAKSRYDTLLYVLNGNTEVACNDDSAGGLLQSSVTFGAAAGTSYSVVVLHTPPEQTPDFSGNTAGNIGYPLSTDGALYFDFQFTPSAPTASLAPGSLPFGTQLINTNSDSQPFSLSNNGPSDLTISSIVASAGFSQTNNCPTSLAANASCDINVVFSPTATGASSGTVTVTDNASNSPQVGHLSGTGTDYQVSITPPASATISAGQQISTTITVAPASGFNSTVALTCSISPVKSLGPTCSFSPNSIQNGSGTSTLTISTSASSSARRWLSMRAMYAFICPLFFGFVGIGWKAKLARRRKLALLFTCLALLCISVFASCGGSQQPPPPPPSGGTPAGSYTANISAAGAGGTRTASLNFTVTK